MTLSIYHLGKVLTLDIRLKAWHRNLSRLLVPLPAVWQAHFARA